MLFLSAWEQVVRVFQSSAPSDGRRAQSAAQELQKPTLFSHEERGYEREKKALSSRYDRKDDTPIVYEAGNVPQIKALYATLAEKGREGSKIKIIPSADDLCALSDDIADSPLKKMAEKNFRLSLLFQNKAQMKTPEALAVLDILRRQIIKNEAVRDNLDVSVLQDDSFARFQSKNITGLLVASTYADAKDGHLHVMGQKTYGGRMIAHLNSVEGSDNMNRIFERVREQAFSVHIMTHEM